MPQWQNRKNREADLTSQERHAAKVGFEPRLFVAVYELCGQVEPYDYKHVV